MARWIRFRGCAEEREATTERLLDREVERRLARLLLQLAGRFGEGDGGDKALRVRLSHQDPSCMVACTREAVSKVIGQFREAGLIETPGSCVVVVLDESGLRKVGCSGRVPLPGATSSHADSSSTGPPRARPAAAARERAGVALGAHAPLGAHPITQDATRESRAGKDLV